MSEALFRRDGELFVPEPCAAGPWHPEVLHGGAPVGLLARMVEQLERPPELQLARLSVDLLRPVPRRALRAGASVLRQGRRMLVAEARLAHEGDTVARAQALFLRAADIAVPADARPADALLPPPAGKVKRGVPGAGHWTPLGLHTTVELCGVTGVAGRGRGAAWLRLPVALVAGEPFSPAQRAAALSDFGNGLAQLSLDADTGCINADVTLYLTRLPEGQWLGLDAECAMETTGIGCVSTRLFDERGQVGRVMQAVVPSVATQD